MPPHGDLGLSAAACSSGRAELGLGPANWLEHLPSAGPRADLELPSRWTSLGRIR